MKKPEVKKPDKTTKKVTVPVMLRMKKSTRRWLLTKLDEDAPTVQERIRQILEKEREADEAKSSK